MPASSPTPKQRARRVVEELPDDATYEDVIARLIVVHKVERGLTQARGGVGLQSQEEVEAEFARRRAAR
ncbi:hypothetical protein RQM47_04460 [Rubrivirga sp. S365]|uniref:Addiction module component n=1 Tax=Rubrivirga litoralis TaxID=3075598 RepID=A0ABU3BM50_9BACT|nr:MULTISPECIES: hypothetical protein [unclassified Rubrivirga]MDT0630374.1 hypothetical protein [Rubrivirga sp. F394]MDT7855885.1 hypothetical protein [Rubrivirga sp. S365]